MRGEERRRALVYGLVAVVATTADVFTVLGLRRVDGLPLVAAVSSGFAVNVLVGFVGSRLFVFRRTSRRLHQAGWRYVVLVMSNLVIAIGGVTAVVAAGVPYLLARAGSSVVIVALNYVVLRAWVFPAALPAVDAPKA